MQTVTILKLYKVLRVFLYQVTDELTMDTKLYRGVRMIEGVSEMERKRYTLERNGRETEFKSR